MSGMTATARELPIPIDRDKIAEFCRARGIVRLSLFGSVTRDDFTPQSDVDVLADFAPQARPGWDYFLYGDQLGQIIGRRVDFCSKLSTYIEPRVRQEAMVIYAE